MTLDDLQQLITVKEVEAALDQQLYDSLTYNRNGGGRPVNVQYAVAASARWGYSRLMGSHAERRTFSADETEVIRQALIKHAVYELGRTSEFKENFDMDRDDADTMFNAVLGRGDGSSDSRSDNGESTGIVGAAGTQYEQVHKPCRTAIYPFTSRRRW